MANGAEKIDKVPWLLVAAVAAGVLLLVLKFLHLLPDQNAGLIALEALFLGAAVFSAVHHAEVLALRVGEPFGSIILALAVTVIEAALIISQMSSGKAGAEFIGRDTVFAGVLIVLSGIVGLCLLVGGARHHEQAFKLDGATSALSVLATLACLALILPNYTLSAVGPYYSASQLAFVGIISVVLYGIFVFVQTVRHREYFVSSDKTAKAHAALKPEGRTVALSSVLLFVSLVVVVLMAKTLSGPIDTRAASRWRRRFRFAAHT